MLAINALKSYSCCLCGSASSSSSSSLCKFLSKSKGKREMNDKKKNVIENMKLKQLILKTSLVCGAFFSLSFSLHFLRQFTIHKLFWGLSRN